MFIIREPAIKIVAVKGAGAVIATLNINCSVEPKELQTITGGQTKGNIKMIAEIAKPDTLTPE